MWDYPEILNVNSEAKREYNGGKENTILPVQVYPSHWSAGRRTWTWSALLRGPAEETTGVRMKECIF